MTIARGVRFRRRSLPTRTVLKKFFLFRQNSFNTSQVDASDSSDWAAFKMTASSLNFENARKYLFLLCFNHNYALKFDKEGA